MSHRQAHRHVVPLPRYVKLTSKISHHILAWGAKCMYVCACGGRSWCWVSFPTILYLGCWGRVSVEFKCLLLSFQASQYVLAFPYLYLSNTDVHVVHYTFLVFTQVLGIWSQAFLFGWQVLYPLSSLTKYKVHIHFHWIPGYLHASPFFSSALMNLLIHLWLVT